MMDLDTSNSPNCSANSDDISEFKSNVKEGITEVATKQPSNSSSRLLKSRPSFKKDTIDAHYDKLHWVAAAFGRLLVLQFAPINIPLSRRLQTFATFFWMSTFLFMGIGSLLLLMYIFFFTTYWWISFGYFTFFLADYNVCNRGGRRIQWVRNWTLWKHFANFFPAMIIKTADLDPHKNYIIGYHPHGILSAGAMAHFGTEGTGFSKLFPGVTSHLAVLNGHFLLPLYRDFLMSSGAVGVSKESISYLLSQEQKGKAVCLVIGGASESLDCHPGDVILHLKKRKGFCKLALKYGASLVPAFSFGENSVYDQYPNPPGSKLRKVQDYLQTVIGLAPCVFMGRGIFQYSFGIVPFRKPINTVFGAPIDVPQVKNPSSEEICDLNKKYVEAVVDLYNKYKHDYAEDPSASITIV